MKKAIILLSLFVLQVSLYAQEYFPEGTRWTEIRLDTLKYDSWYSKIDGEWVPNFETIEYYVQGEYVDKYGNTYKCVYTNGPEWTDSLTILLDERGYNKSISATAQITDDGVTYTLCPGQTYQFDWNVGQTLSFRTIKGANTTCFPPCGWYNYGLIEEIKEGDFGGVSPLKYVDLDGKAPVNPEAPWYTDTNGARIIQGIGVTEWDDGECLFGPSNPYYALMCFDPDGWYKYPWRNYRSMLVHFERNGEVLYDVWPAKEATSALADVEINETTFPDEKFRTWVIAQSYGQDGILTEEEIASVTNINVMYKGIQSLKGIEYFTSLTYLNCYTNKLTEIDVSNNTKLTTLYCEGNSLTELDVSKCPGLIDLECERNQLIMLDVSQNTALTTLICDDNPLTTLDISNNTQLIYLSCQGNQLTAIDVTKNTELENLYCKGNQLTELDVSKNKNLKWLICSNNQLTMFELESLPKLESLKCIHNRLERIIVSNCSELWEINCFDNRIKGEAMDELIEGLAIIPEGWGHLCVVDKENEQNVMTKAQVAAAKAKGWNPRYKFGAFGTPEYVDYEGIDEPVSFTEGQMATIILPEEPDAGMGKYYKLDRVEEGKIVFEQELHPQAHIPYIIVPNEDFSIDLSTLDLEGLRSDTVSIEVTFEGQAESQSIYFIGSYVNEELEQQEGCNIQLIDTTPDCSVSSEEETGKGAILIGALRAYLEAKWDAFEYDIRFTNIVLYDQGTGIEEIKNEELRIKNDEAIYDLQGRSLPRKPTHGIYIENGKKRAR